MSHSFRVGDRVHWTDPAEDVCSADGTVAHVQHGEDDAVIGINMDAGGYAEAFPCELKVLNRPES